MRYSFEDYRTESDFKEVGIEMSQEAKFTYFQEATTDPSKLT